MICSSVASPALLKSFTSPTEPNLRGKNAGMLPVAYGMAAAGGTGLVVAPALLAAFGIMSAYTMISIGRACEHTRQWSFRGLWADLVGKESAWVSAWESTVKTNVAVVNVRSSGVPNALRIQVFYQEFFLGQLTNPARHVSLMSSGRDSLLAFLLALLREPPANVGLL